MTALAPARKKSKVVWIGLGLVLVLLLVVALLPTLLGSFVAGKIESAFSERFEGRLEVASLQLAWRERQQISAARLLDPDGGEVARLSAELPSILDLVQSEGLRLGLFTAKVDARLIADDAGITNLQRALMPRPGVSGDSSAGAQAEDGAKPLDPSQLEFEFVLQAPLVAWSDAVTRASGADFEIRDLWVRARAERGKALDLELRGTVGGSGALQGRAQIEGLSTNPERPFTRATANLDVRGLSCGLVDGLARMNGDLPTLLGPALDLSLALDASGLENGSVRFALGSERAQVQFAAGLSERVLRLEGERGAELSLNIPFERIERALSGQLPPGFSLQSPQENLRIALRIPRLETRLELPAQSTAAQWARFAREMQAQFQLSIASPLSFQTPELAKANLRPLMRDLLLRGAIAPGQPLQLGASTLLDTGVPGTLKLSVASADLLDAIAGGEEPHVDVRLEITDISNAFLDALIGQEDLLASGAGQALDIDLVADGVTTSSADFKLELRSARLDLKASGRWTPERLTASGDDGLDLLFSPDTSWWTRFVAIELAGYKPEVLSGRLRAKLRSLDVPLDFSDLRRVEDQLSAALQLELPVLALRRGEAAVGLRSPKLNVSVARGGTVGFRLDSQLSANWVSRLELLGELQGWSGIAEGRIPKWSADFNLDELDVAALESLSGAELGLLQRLGERADLRVRAEELDESGGRIALDLQAPKWKLNLQAAGANRRFNTTARLEGLLVQEDLDAELARFAPAGLKLMREDDLPLVVELSESSVTLPARERMGDPDAWLEALAARVQLTVPSMGIRQPALDPSGVQLRHEGLKAQIAIANHSVDADLRVDLEDVTGKYAALAGSRLALHAKLAGWFDSQELQLELQSERGQLAARVRHADGRIELLEQDGLTLKWKPDTQHATSELRSLLPATIQLDALDPANFELLLRARGGSLTLPRDAAGMQLGAGLQLDAELPPLSLRLGGAQSPALVLKGTKLSADEQGRARLSTRLQPDGSGSLVVEITPGAGLDAVLRDLGPMAITLKGSGVPLAAIDALLEPAGMLTEMLGSSVELQLESPAWNPASAEIKGWIRSPQFAVEVQALAGTDGVRITQPSGLAASFGIGPLSSENFLGGVLPMVCAVTKPAEAKPARLVVNQLNFPLGADLSKLDADLTLELGEIQYAWLPGLSEAFGSAATVEKTRLAAFPIRIQQGVVRYDKLPLKLSGKEVMFSGSYQLTDHKIALNFSVPLEILGRKVSKELEKARDFIDPKLAVPLEIRGTPTAPKLSIGKGFLESVVKQALERQLQKGLESLFSDDEEKPKKP